MKPVSVSNVERRHHVTWIHVEKYN